MSSREEKMTALNNAVAAIEKNFGKGSVMKLGDASNIQVDTIPTGSISLDVALGGRRDSAGEGSLRSTDRSPVVRRQSPCI